MIEQSKITPNSKIIISIIVGLITLWASPHGITSTIGTVKIDIPWSLIFPIIISIAFGWRYGLLSGLSGAALFPFLLWPDNGYANLGTTIIFLLTFTLIGLSNNYSIGKKIKNFQIRLAIALSASIAVISFHHILLFNPLLSINPPFWVDKTITHLPLHLLFTFVIKDCFNIILLSLITETIFRLPLVRHLLKIPIKKKMAENTKIFTATMLSAILVWLIFIGLSWTLFNNVNLLNDHHIILAFSVIISAGFFASRMLFKYSEMQLKIQLELRESEALHRLLTDNSTDIIVRHDVNGNYLYISPACNALLGYHSEDLIGHHPIEFIHPDDAGAITELITRTLVQYHYASSEFRFRCKNGNYIWLESNSHFITDPISQEVIEIHTSSRDITNRKKAEIELTESKANLIGIIENTQDSIWSINTKYEITYINNVFQQAFLANFGTFLQPGINLLLSIPEPLRNIWKARYDRVLKNESYSFEEAINLGTTTIYIEVSLNPILVDNRVVGASFFSRDVTPRRQDEIKLKESENKFKALYENANDAIFILNDGLFFDCNPTTLKTFKCSLDEIIGKSPADFSPTLQPDGTTSVEKAIILIYKANNGIAQKFEWKHMRANGELFDAEVLLNSVIINQKPMLQAIVRDITERKLSEKAIIESEKRYKSITDGLTDYLYTVIIEDNKAVETIHGEACFAITGYTSKELSTDPYLWYNMIYEDDKASVRSKFQSILDGNTTEPFEHRIICKDGTIRWLCDTIIPRFNISGKLISYDGVIKDITERKQAEEKLRESERILLESQAVGHIGSYITDLKTSKWQSTAELEKIFGIYQNENYPHTLEGWVGFIHPDSKEKLFAYHQEVVDQRKRFEHEYQIIRINDGEHRWVQGTGELEYDSNNVPIRMLGVIQDITERKQAEDALKSLATNYANLSGKAFFEAVTKHIAQAMKLDYVFVGELTPNKERVNVLGGTAYGNPMGSLQYDLLFTPCNNVANNHVCIYSTGIQQEYPNDELLIQMGIEAYIGAPLLDKNNNPLGVLVALHSKPILNTETIANYFNFFIDRVSAELQRLRASEDLRKSEEKLSALFSSMAEMVLLHELVFNNNGEVIDYRITDCNNAYITITGLKKEAIIGKLGSELYQTETPPYLEEYSKVAITGDPFEYNNYISPLDKHFMVSVVSPSKNTFATITTDITSIRQIQEVITAKNQELENYLYVTSHDLRSPLVNIQGFSQRLQKQADAINKEIAECPLDLEEKNNIEKITHDGIPKTLDFIFTNVAKMDMLINGLLQISRTGRIKMTIKQIDTNNLFQTIISSLNYQLTELGITVKVEKLDNCFGDEVLLNQLFTNIISNAIKYRDKKRELTIEISSSIQFKRVIYTIKDNGIGIAPRHLEKIWDVFYRVDSSAPESGEGIGLSLVKRITDKHRGKVWAESIEGEGTTFFIGLQKNEFTE